MNFKNTHIKIEFDFLDGFFWIKMDKLIKNLALHFLTLGYKKNIFYKFPTKNNQHIFVIFTYYVILDR